MNERNLVNWFELPVTDLARARAFYERVLGIELQLQSMGQDQMAWFPMSQNGPGTGGALIKARGYVPSYEGTLIYFSVEQIEPVLERVEPAGGELIQPKQSLGQYGFFALFQDSEGNRVGLHQKA